MKMMTMTTKIPLLNISPVEMVPWIWASLPGIAFGAVVTVVLLYLRGYAVRMHVARRTAAQVMAEPWYLWPFYLLRHLSAWYLLAIGVVLAANGMPLGKVTYHYLDLGFRLLTILQVGLLVSTFVKDGVGSYVAHHSKMDGGRKMILNAMTTVVTLLLWALVLMAGMNAVGINVSAMLAGLGLGGVAIAFATKNILENVLASLSMVMNPPFVIGDFIIVGSMMGTVEKITLKNVQIRSLGGEMLFIPSNDLINSRISNYTLMKERRVEMKFGIGYEGMTPEKLKAIPALIAKVVKRYEKVATFDRAHVAGFGDDLIRMEVVFIVKTGDYNAYMDVQQDVLQDIYLELAKVGVGLGLSARVGALSEVLSQPHKLPAMKAKKK